MARSATDAHTGASWLERHESLLSLVKLCLFVCICTRPMCDGSQHLSEFGSSRRLPTEHNATFEDQLPIIFYGRFLSFADGACTDAVSHLLGYRHDEA